MIANVLVRNAWYVAGLSAEFPPGELKGQIVAEKPLVLWRTAEGRVVAFDDRCCHKRVPLIEQDGLVWVWPGNAAKAETARPPRVPEMADEGWDTADVNGAMHVRTNSLLLIENLLDITHFYPLHDGNIGDIENSRIPIKVEEGESEGNHFVGTVREVRGYRQPPYLEEYFGYDFVDRYHTHFMLSPGLTRVQMRVWP